MLLQTGDMLDEFRILEPIGDGGFSVVYKAEDTHLDRIVAIKQLNPGAFTEYSTEERFIREAKLAASLNHPNIVSIYAFKRRQDSLCMVMEYLDGGSVRDLVLQYGFLPQAMLLKLATHVCHALDVLHQRGIIHRDIKPENILCSTTGDFKLVDFGLAHNMWMDRRRNSAGPQSGTLLYMSPEQAAGEDITSLTDIYSFAAVLYEALTGLYYLPTSDDENDMIGTIRAFPPIPPSEANNHTPGAFDAVLLHALQKKPEQRYQTAGEFLEALKAAATRRKRTMPNTPQTIDRSAELYTIRTLRDLLGEPEQAMARLDAPWLQDSHAPEVLAERGETMLALGNNAGYELLEMAVASKPSLPFAQMALAERYKRQGDQELYATSLIKAIEADADLVYAMYYGQVVDSLAHGDEFWDFVALFGAAWPSAQVKFNLGRLLMLASSYESEAIAAFQAAIRQKPTFGPAYVALGSAWLGMGRSAEAIPYFEEATRLEFPVYPTDEWHKSPSAYRRSHAYTGLALAYMDADQPAHSAQAARAAFELAPADLTQHIEPLTSRYCQIAAAWLEAGKDQEAYDLLMQIQPIAETSTCASEARLLLGSAQARIGSLFRKQQAYADAVAWLESAVETLHTVPADDPVSEHVAQRLHDTVRELNRARQSR